MTATRAWHQLYRVWHGGSAPTRKSGNSDENSKHVWGASVAKKRRKISIVKAKMIISEKAAVA